MFVTVLDTDGSQQVAFHLDEAAIALRLKNKDPAFQAQLKPDQRTAKERAHRVADALAAICKHYKAQLAVENISYRRHSGQPRFSGVGNDNSRSVKELLHYKLALAGLPDAFDIKVVAPRRDCGRCGKRHSSGQL